MSKKIFLGMSGGVDSSVAACLLKEAGYDVQGVTLLLKPPSESRDRDVEDARLAAERLGIPFFVCDRTKQFESIVIRNFIREYRAGRTPNPCVLCNSEVKIAALSEFAKKNGGDLIATGHYADILTDAAGKKHIKCNPYKKDQSYFLSMLTREQVDSILFPLGKMDKTQVRSLAVQYGLPCADKGDSQEVCFIPDNDYGKFLTDYGKLEPIPGDFIDSDGKVLGKHRGIPFYTYGQRRGLEIALGERMYVTQMDPVRNTVMLCREQERYITEVSVKNLHLISGEAPLDHFVATVKIRSTAKPQQAQLQREKDLWKITLSQPQTAAAPGQTVAFYDGDLLLGGGTVV